MDLPSLPSEERNARLAEALAAAARELEPLVAESRRAQAEMHEFRSRYEHRRPDAPLTRGSLHEIRKGTKRYLDLQRELAALVRRADPLAAGMTSKLAALGVEPALASWGTSTALLAAVTMYDNHLSMLPLLGHKHFRRLVNQPDLGYGISRDALWDLVERLNDRVRLHRVERIAQHWSKLESRDDGALERLVATISTSTTYPFARDATLAQRLPTSLLIRRERFLDRLAELGGDVMYTVSQAFGNAIGRFEFRKGKLWRREDVIGHLHRVLRPLDLLLEKTPFRLTDYIIPGHFGHVAIWMGKPRQLRRLKIWEQEAMQEDRLQHCRPMIEEGRSVLEALRSGVELNALRVFANVDDLAILRPKRLRRKERRASLVRGFQQVGKAYDFNFDVETTGTIVCSELPYHVYPGVEWTTEEQLGRFTISPDHIALEALGGDANFDLVAFYHDGALVPRKDAKSLFSDLVT